MMQGISQPLPAVRIASVGRLLCNWPLYDFLHANSTGLIPGH